MQKYSFRHWGLHQQSRLRLCSDAPTSSLCICSFGLFISHLFLATSRLKRSVSGCTNSCRRQAPHKTVPVVKPQRNPAPLSHCRRAPACDGTGGKLPAGLVGLGDFQQFPSSSLPHIAAIFNTCIEWKKQTTDWTSIWGTCKSKASRERAQPHIETTQQAPANFINELLRSPGRIPKHRPSSTPPFPTGKAHSYSTPCSRTPCDPAA